MFITEGMVALRSKPRAVEVLSTELEITLLRAGYSRFTGRDDIHRGIREWFCKYVPQISDGEILVACDRMCLIEESDRSMSMEREAFILRCLFFRAYILAREASQSAPLPEMLRRALGSEIDDAVLRELLRRVFESSVQVMPASL